MIFNPVALTKSPKEEETHKHNCREPSIKIAQDKRRYSWEAINQSTSTVGTHPPSELNVLLFPSSFLLFQQFPFKNFDSTNRSDQCKLSFKHASRKRREEEKTRIGLRKYRKSSSPFSHRSAAICVWHWSCKEEFYTKCFFFQLE